MSDTVLERKCAAAHHCIALPATACACGLFIIERMGDGIRYFSPRYKPSKYSAVCKAEFLVRIEGDT